MKIINVMASTLDGRIGAVSLESDAAREQLGISSAVDREVLRGEVAQSDAIIVGATSIRANGSALDWPGRRGRPHWYIMARTALEPNLEFWSQDSVPRTVVSPSAMNPPKNSDVTCLVCRDPNPAPFVVERIRRQGFQRVLLFGGGFINQFFYNSQLVDELKLTLSPMFLGKAEGSFLVAPELHSPVRFTLISSMIKENYVFLNYLVRR